MCERAGLIELSFVRSTALLAFALLAIACDDDRPASCVPGVAIACVGPEVVTSMTNVDGCATVRSSTLSGGLYYLAVLPRAETESARQYTLHVRVVP